MFDRENLNRRFSLVIFTFVAIVFVIYRDGVLGPLLAPVTVFTAQATLALLHVLGIEAARFGTVISHPGGFAYDIHYRCTGVLPVAFLVVSILAYPRPLPPRLVGVAIGVPLLIALNFVRLVHLFQVGVQHPAAYHLLHKVLWEGVIVAAVLGLWLSWRRWARGRQPLVGMPSPVHERSGEERMKSWPTLSRRSLQS